MTVPKVLNLAKLRGGISYSVTAARSESPSLISKVFAAGPKDTPPPKLEDKDKWKENFEVREVETGLASFDKVQVVVGLKSGDEVAVEDPTRPKEKKGRD